MRLIIIIPALLLFIGCSTQTSQIDINKNKEKPLIKSCKIYTYHYNSDDLEEGILIEEFEYDKLGNHTKLTRYDTLGNIICSFNYKYDNSGNLTEKIWREASQTKNEAAKVSLDEISGDLDEIDKGHQTGSNAKYDQSGKLVEKIWNDPQGEADIKETHHYYEDGREKEVVYYNENDKIERKVVHAYDSLGNEIAILTYNKTNELINKISYNFDEYGNVIEDIYWDTSFDKPVQIIRYVYEFY